MRTTVTQSNYRRKVAAVLAERLLRELALDESPVEPTDRHEATLRGVRSAAVAICPPRRMARHSTQPPYFSGTARHSVPPSSAGTSR